MIECRASTTAQCYKGQIIVTGGHNNWNTTDSTETAFLGGIGAIPYQWYPLPIKLPEKFAGHKTFIHNRHLWTVGEDRWRRGEQNLLCSNNIKKVSLQPPFSSTLEANMPQTLSYHGLEKLGDEIMTIGGSTNGYRDKAVNRVMSYNTETKEFLQMPPLPFAMLDMATVCIGEDVLIIGGKNLQGESLNTILKYNHKTMQCTRLPSMRYRRAECAAVVSGHKVFVMGGLGYRPNSVECFDLHDEVWMELPPMKEARYKFAAVCAPFTTHNVYFSS